VFVLFGKTFPENSFAKSLSSIFEKSKFKSFDSSSFKITKFGSCTGVGFISSLNVLDSFEYVLSKCQLMVILINLLQLDFLLL
jgi:hypothetical protein